MMLPAHLAAGLLVGKYLGHPAIAVLFSLLPDIDHLWVYARNGVLRDKEKFWHAVTSPEDAYGNQRNWMHTIFVWAPMSVALWFLDPATGIVIAAAWGGHLVIDLLDKSPMYPLYPLRFSVPGIIGYGSVAEWVFTGALVAVFIFA